MYSLPKGERLHGQRERKKCGNMLEEKKAWKTKKMLGQKGELAEKEECSSSKHQEEWRKRHRAQAKLKKHPRDFKTCPV